MVSSFRINEDDEMVPDGEAAGAAEDEASEVGSIEGLGNQARYPEALRPDGECILPVAKGTEAGRYPY